MTGRPPCSRCDSAHRSAQETQSGQHEQHTHQDRAEGLVVFQRDHKGNRITDHADGSNFDFIIPRIVMAAEELSGVWPITVIPGIEITHVPPSMIAELVEEARALGAIWVVCHGESPVEPVEEGTNRAGILSGADMLAHPGFITKQDAALAARKGVYLEITARKGHSLTNGHVAKVATEAGASLVINTDSHEPGDLVTDEFARSVLLGAGLSTARIAEVMKNSKELAAKAVAALR